MYYIHTYTHCTDIKLTLLEVKMENMNQSY